MASSAPAPGRFLFKKRVLDSSCSRMIHGAELHTTWIFNVMYAVTYTNPYMVIRLGAFQAERTLRTC